MSAFTSPPLTTSAADTRTYRHITLTNALQVLLISDPTSEKSAAAMDVRVGHLSDPECLPGLAHFLEHMLFMGTEKFPDENEYSKYLSEHGGSSNAFTDTEDTNYYFDVNSEHYAGAVTRFAQFFVAPLFTDSATARETLAVNSENSKNFQNDFWRSFQLMKSMARPDHPFSKFGTGNSDTLKDDPENGVVVRDELLKFHATYYSANVMTLVLLGADSLDGLESLAVEHFSDIANTDISKPVFPGEPYRKSDLNRVLRVVPIKDARSLDFSFPLPPVTEHYMSKPTGYLSHLLGHESAGSMISVLKKMGLANDLWAGTARSCSDWSSFQIGVGLTEEGMAKTDEVCEVVFSYINMLIEEGPKEWIYEETSNVARNNFRFLSQRQPDDYACSLATRMQEYPPVEVLSGPYLTTEYNPELIASLASLLTPDNMILTITSREFKDKTDKTEKWYGSEYSDEPLDADKVKKWANIRMPADLLHFPEKNELIATDFELRNEQVKSDPSVKYEADVPTLLLNDNGNKLWFLPDTKFKMPKLNVMTALNTPLVYSSPDQFVLSQMYASALNEVLNEFNYMAAMAGASVSVSGSRKGVDMTLYGYSHKLPVLLDKVLEIISEFTESVDEQLFERLKDKKLKQMRNDAFSPPYSHAGQASNYALGPTLFGNEERIGAMEDMTLKDLKDFSGKVLSRCGIEMLVHGNANEEEARRLLSILLAGVKPKPLFESARGGGCLRVVQLEDASETRFVFDESNPEEANSSVQNIYQLGGATIENSSMAYFLTHVMSEPAFDVLRTKEQLGYIVHTSTKVSENILAIQFIIQGDSTSPGHIDSRIEAFLDTFRKMLADMPEKTFNNHVTACVEKLLETDKSLNEVTGRVHAQINNGRYVFDRGRQEAAVIKELHARDALRYFDRKLASEGRERKKFSCWCVGKEWRGERENEDGVEKKEGVVVMREGEQGDFKNHMALWPLNETVDFERFA